MGTGICLIVMGCMLLGGTVLSGCAEIPQVPNPTYLSQTCKRPELPPVKKQTQVQREADIAAFSVQQEAALDTCDAKRQAYNDIVNDYNHNLRVAQCPWWHVWKCK